MLSACFTVCTLGYAAAGVLGYLMFGQEVESQVTLNLPTGKFSSHVAIFTTLVNPITKYALMLTPVINAVKNKVSWHYNKRFTHMFVSTSMLISTLIVAVAIPLFGIVFVPLPSFQGTVRKCSKDWMFIFMLNQFLYNYQFKTVKKSVSIRAFYCFFLKKC